MKKFLAQIAVVLLLTTQVFAQPNKRDGLPTIVSSAFSSRFPEAEIKYWRLEGDLYVLKYKTNSIKHFAYYTANGDWLKSETHYEFTHSIPAAVKRGWKSSGFILWDIQDIEEVETPNAHQFVYTVVDIHSWDFENVGSQRKFKLTLAMDGSLVKKQELRD